MTRATVFFLGSHPALSAAELFAAGERFGWDATWDPSRLPVALSSDGILPSPADMQPLLGGTTMIGTLRATFPRFPEPDDVLEAIPELQQEHKGKRLIGVSALALHPSGASGVGLPHSRSQSDSLVDNVRGFAMELKRAVGRKGTRVVFPPSRRSDLSTAQLLHNGLPHGGVALMFLVAPDRVDLVTIDAIQDIENYARRDRGRPYADPGRGMVPPKVAQMLINLSRVPAGGILCDPFCGVGTIPMEAVLLGLNVIASDISPTQVERTKENLSWLAEVFPSAKTSTQVFVHNMTKGVLPLKANLVHAIVTEGWLGPARNSSPLALETKKIFSKVSELLRNAFERTRAVIHSGGSFVVTVPAFRVKKRLFRFPLEQLSAAGWKQESLVPDGWRDHAIFRDAAQGTLLYGRPDAIVLREIVRFRKTQ